MRARSEIVGAMGPRIYNFWRSGTAVAAAIVLARAFLAAKKFKSSDLRLFSSFFNQDHQLKSSQLELNPYSAGDSDA